MPYTADATDVGQPTDSGVKASTAAAEFRTLKLYMRDVLLVGLTGKANSASPVFSGNATFDDVTVTGDLTVPGTAAFVQSPTGPTPSAGDDSTKLATTEFVTNAALSTTLPGIPGAYGQEITSDGTQALWGFSAGSALGIFKFFGG